ncbi:MAG: AraC family transcriptional regulator [Anaerolineae bacterium]
MDVLTDILNTLHLKSTVYCQATLCKTAWALEFTQTQTTVFHIVSHLEEGCCLRVEGIDYRVQEGDLIVLRDAHRFYNADDAPLCAVIALDSNMPHNCTILRYGDEAPTITLVCGTFNFERQHGLAPILPPILHFQQETLEAYGMESTVAGLIREANMRLPGTQTLLTRLADILFVQVVRAWIENPTSSVPGWLHALSDPPIAQALSQMHAAPSHPWTLVELANAAALSRSAFAARFHALVGETPIHYLTRWRIHLACQILQQETCTLVEVALRVGYGSEMAFSKAFKRMIGMSPGQYRKQGDYGIS